MKKEIVINASKDRARIAIVEDGQLAELYVEHPDNVRTLGNIYLGKVAKVMTQIHAAFVDIGQKQDAFLHFSDLTENAPQLFVMAGEDVPGLEAPILARAPQKRVADDESEPDIEETLEVEDAADESQTARTGRSRSRRRRRGGRGRRGGQGRSGDGRKTEEEEEQEERRLPHIIDLTQKSGSVRPTPAPKPEPASGEDDSDSAPEAEKPKRTRSRAKKKTEDASGDTDAPTTDGDTPEAEEAPKPKRARSRKKKVEDDAAQDADETPEAEDAPKPKRTRSRKKKETSEEASGEDASDSDAAPDAEEKPKRTRSRARKKTEDTDDASGDEAEAKPKGRTRTPKQEKSDHEKREDADDAPEAEKPKRTRSRSKKKAEEAPEAEAPVAEAKAEEKKPVSHAAKHTIDLSTPSRPRRPAPKEEESDDAPRSRRSRSTSEDDASGDDSGRSRRGRSKQDDASGDDSSTSRRGRRSDNDDESSDDSRSRRRSRSDSDDSEDDSRSRRGRRSTGDDESSDSDDSRRRSSKKDEDADGDDARGSRRRRGGRGQSSKDDSDESDDSRSSRSGRSRSSESRSDDGGRAEETRDRGRNAARGGRSGNGRSSGGGQKAASTWNGKAEDLLKRGSRVLVKITKEPISAKGSRVSTDISLAGRFLVLVPAADYVAVSKKIESSKERRRLRALASSLKPANCGVIVRTVAGGQDAKALDQDLRLLINKWNKIEAKLDGGNAEPPILLHEDVDMVSSIVRDLFSSDFDRILVDDPHLHRKLHNYVKAVAPEMADKVQMHRSNQPVFRACGIEKQVEEAFSERVNMKGGGYLIIEHTEAMHVVDVNSGRAGRGKRRAEENLLAVNMEAAKEIGRQLRLRDLGGIICVDFIDLRHDRDRRKVTDAIKKEFAKDRAVTKVIGMSDFGVMQITRQRLRPSITAQDDSDGMDAMEAAGATEIVQPERDHPEPAPEAQESRSHSRDSDRQASGGGRSRRGDSRRGDSRRASNPPSEDVSPVQLAERVRDWLTHYRDNVDEKFARKPIVVSVHPLMGSYLRRGFPSPLTRLRFRLRSVPFQVVDDPKVDPLSFEVVDEKSGRPLRSKYPLNDD